MSLAAYCCAFVTNGHVVSTTLSPSATAWLFCSGPTPWERMITVSSGSTLSRSATTSSPRLRKEFTTCGLWIKDPSDFARAPATSMVSFAILMARFTPKQKPALSATITSMCCLLLRAQRRDHIHDLSGVSAHLFPLGVARNGGHHWRAECDPDRDLLPHRTADLVRACDARGRYRSPRDGRETPHPGPGGHKLAALVPGPLGENEDGPARGKYLLRAAKPRSSLCPSLNRDRIIRPDEGSEQGIMEQFGLRDEVHLAGEMRPHKGWVPERNVVAGHDQGPLSGDSLQPFDLEIEKCPGEEPGEPAPEGVHGPDPPRGLHRQGGPPGGQVHLFFGPD